MTKLHFLHLKNVLNVLKKRNISALFDNSKTLLNHVNCENSQDKSSHTKLLRRICCN